MDVDTINRLKTSWKKGREYYTSFFSVLNNVRKEIGDEALPNWCFDNLNIGLSVILDYRKLLGPVEARKVADNFAAANKAEKEQKKLKLMQNAKLKQSVNIMKSLKK